VPTWHHGSSMHRIQYSSFSEPMGLSLYFSIRHSSIEQLTISHCSYGEYVKQCVYRVGGERKPFFRNQARNARINTVFFLRPQPLKFFLWCSCAVFTSTKTSIDSLKRKILTSVSVPNMSGGKVAGIQVEDLGESGYAGVCGMVIRAGRSAERPWRSKSSY
jgi:hypothetical protein